ncbi:hypothetical protein Droror1_Dr00004457 [Drosera rotundifolia]
MACPTMPKLIATAFICAIMVAPQAKAHYSPDPITSTFVALLLSVCYGYMETGKTDSLFYNEFFCCVAIRIVDSWAYSSPAALKDTCFACENIVKLFHFNPERGRQLLTKCNVNSTYAFDTSLDCLTLKLP